MTLKTVLGLAVIFAAGPALAAESKIDPGDTAWMLVSTALVLMMTLPGLALFYAGMVRKKNLLATTAQSLATCALVSVLWMTVGYSLAFTEGNPFIGDLSRAFLNGMTMTSTHSLAKTVPEVVFMMFQMTFAIITPALIVGAVADRLKFSAMLWFMAAWLLLVYVPLAHWVWGGGFLGAAGVLDFAGGIVVHINAGIAGLVAALVIGKRIGYGTENLSPHNLTWSVVGVSLLWVGWFGFNAGSAVAADARAGMAMAATHLAAAGAALAWMAAEWRVMGKPSVLGIVSGAVAGLGTVTPASGYITPASGLIIGLVAGGVCFWASVLLKRRLGYDDSLDVFGVHGVGGVLGTIATGVFATVAIAGLTDKGEPAASGLVDGNAGQILTQAFGAGVAIIYCAAVTWVILKVIDALVGLRVSEEEEREGLDTVLHGESLQ
ncbi:MAG: ammonium transporter [Alphaproteobacteria bacterium]|nr:ammonium transporter [Alphaproteobacteria bacterium]